MKKLLYLLPTSLLLLGAAKDAAALVIIAEDMQPGVDTVFAEDEPVFGTFDFSGQNFDALQKITSITVTLTVRDGDTINDDVLALGLDGINTGILLDDFGDGLELVEQKSYGGVPNNAAQILAALQSDGVLIANILDLNPNLDMKNGLGLPDAMATLEIEGLVTPIPAALPLLATGLGALGFAASRRRQNSVGQATAAA